MAIDYEHLLNYEIPAREQTYTERDVMLYALSLGVGIDPMNRAELPFVYEKDSTIRYTAIPTSRRRPASIDRSCMDSARMARQGTRSCERFATTTRCVSPGCRPGSPRQCFPARRSVPRSGGTAMSCRFAPVHSSETSPSWTTAGSA